MFYFVAETGRIVELKQRRVAKKAMRRRALSKSIWASLGAALLLFSQLSSAGELCLTTATGLGMTGMDASYSPSPAQPHDAMAGADGDCCGANVGPTICVVQQDAITVGIPVATASPSFLAAPCEHPIDRLIDLRQIAQVAVASASPPHPSLSILYCRYLN